MPNRNAPGTTAKRKASNAPGTANTKKLPNIFGNANSQAGKAMGRPERTRPTKKSYLTFLETPTGRQSDGRTRKKLPNIFAPGRPNAPNPRPPDGRTRRNGTPKADKAPRASRAKSPPQSASDGKPAERTRQST